MIRMIDVDQENRILRETLRTRPGFGGQKEVRPVGSTERVPLQARIIAATNRDLEAAVRQGTFRQDLFFRLNVVQIKIPPLRERKTDIQPLVNSFLEKFSDPSGKMRTISEDGMARLMSYDWPGNVRELENAIERAIALGSGPILHAGDLPTSLQHRTNEQLPQNEELLPLEELERRAILRALREAGDDKLAAARMPAHDELEMLRPVRRVLERFARPVIDREGARVGWLEMYYDVTGERQIQSKLLQTEKMAAVGQLVSGIAHELNNRLTSIMGYVQLLLSHGLNPAQFSEAGKVFHEAERARRIVKNLLYFARENEPERTRVDLNAIVERTLALRSYEMKVEDILIERDLEPELPETMADPYQLQQVVLNLLINAEQALLQDRGKGVVRVQTRRAEGNRIAAEVSDDGPGIPREILSRIFDPFFTTKPSGLGTGLGLSIVYGIVQQHDGEVSVENLAGGGARFVVELPVIAIPAKNNSPAEREPRLQGVAPKSKVLVVEDEPTVAQLIVDVLREEGHQVDAVLDSQEGLTRLSRVQYDLVICDLRMPRLDGPAFYDALVHSGSAARDRLMFITGDTLAPRTMKFLQSSKMTYLAKPFLVEELKLAVNRRLEAIEQEQGQGQLVGARPPKRRSVANRT
jgi:DNA-binding NtrC family response regulator/nitrogen-specific signal transduction histidine kinase